MPGAGCRGRPTFEQRLAHERIAFLPFTVAAQEDDFDFVGPGGPAAQHSRERDDRDDTMSHACSAAGMASNTQNNPEHRRPGVRVRGCKREARKRGGGGAGRQGGGTGFHLKTGVDTSVRGCAAAAAASAASTALVASGAASRALAYGVQLLPAVGLAGLKHNARCSGPTTKNTVPAPTEDLYDASWVKATQSRS